jgi:hypothetical protein
MYSVLSQPLCVFHRTIVLFMLLTCAVLRKMTAFHIKF